MDNFDDEINEMINTREMKEALLHGEWKEEAKQIPFYAVSEYERNLLVMCINEQPFDDKELHDLEMLLGQYRGAIEKYEPEVTLDNVEKNIQLVNDEKEILRLMKESREEQILNFNYPLTSDVTIKYKLLVFNEIDAEAIDDLQQNIELFADLTQDEMQLYSDYNDGKTMTDEELAIVRHIEDEINRKGVQNINGMVQTAISFLSKQTRIADDPDSTEEGMRQIYEAMKLGYLMALFEKVQGMIGVSNIETEDLFR